MYSKFLSTIEKHGLLTPNSSVLVALSGGADSVLMLRLLCRYRKDFGLNITAAHLNHGLRGEESDGDEAFVVKLCQELNVPLKVKRVDIHSECKKSGEGCEECGRRIRYEFFNSVVGDGVIATAHNLDDRAETLIMNIIRGSGLNGLCSIAPKRDNIIRPLIEIPKSDILEYCEKNEFEYVTDSSNLTDIYRRNQIRHNIIPYLFETNPSFDKAAVRMFDILEKDNKFLNQLAQDALDNCILEQNVYDAVKLKNLPEPLLFRVLILAAQNSGAGVENLHVDMMRNILAQGGKINLPRNFFAFCNGEKFEFFKFEQKSSKQSDNNAEIVAMYGENNFLGKKILLNPVASGQDNYCKKVHNMLSYNLLDCDKICGKIVLRNRREGDSISLINRNITKSLKKLFSEAKLSPQDRQHRIVVCDDNGVIFVEGFGPHNRVAVGQDTKKILRIDISDSEELHCHNSLKE